MTHETTHEHAVEHLDDYGAKLGMWIFLFTEIFFFGGLFLVYTVYRYMFPEDFHNAALHLDVVVGAVNTVLLLTSSLTMSIAVSSVQRGDAALAMKMITVSLVLGVIFLINKYFEWDHKILLGLYPGSELMLTLKHGYILYFGLYFFMTGLHALHIVIGLVLLTICLYKVSKGTMNSDRNMLIVNSTLYWHLVDVIWLLLFPLLYLIH